MWAEEYIFHNEGEKFCTLNRLDFTPRAGDFIRLPVSDITYRVVYLLNEDEPHFDVRPRKLTTTRKVNIFLRKEVDTMFDVLRWS